MDLTHSLDRIDRSDLENERSNYGTSELLNKPINQSKVYIGKRSQINWKPVPSHNLQLSQSTSSNELELFNAPSSITSKHNETKKTPLKPTNIKPKQDARSPEPEEKNPNQLRQSIEEFNQILSSRKLFNTERND